ncbi:hypothetical protein DAI22_01g369900 [Oryza sativa Japonica Group]|nr:hypothetical protein DAI22_01g369900 [Oryza sativa Japonica Group]
MMGARLLWIGCVGSSGWTAGTTGWIDHGLVRATRNGDSCARRIASTSVHGHGMAGYLLSRNRST